MKRNAKVIKLYLNFNQNVIYRNLSIAIEPLVSVKTVEFYKAFYSILASKINEIQKNLNHHILIGFVKEIF